MEGSRRSGSEQNACPITRRKDQIMAYNSTKQPGISATCHYRQPPTRALGAICSPCRLHIAFASPDPSLVSETGRNLECYPTNQIARSPGRVSSRSMASALVHFTRPSTNLIAPVGGEKVGCPCAFVNTPDISWRMIFSWGSPSHSGVLDPAARPLQLTHFSLHQYLLGRHTSRLNLDPRPTPPQSSDR